MTQIYEGFYAKLITPDKTQGSMFMNSDNIVGDDYEVYFKTEEGRVVAWARNKFGSEMGHFDVDASRKLQLAHAREMKIRAVLAYVAFSDESDSGSYWGQMAVFCFAPRYADEMNAFIDRVASKLSEGVRPVIDLGNQATKNIVEQDGWIPRETMPLPKKEEGVAILKDHRTANEKIIEQARAGNKGCYAISIAFIIVVVLAIAFGLYSWFA